MKTVTSTPSLTRGLFRCLALCGALASFTAVAQDKPLQIGTDDWAPYEYAVDGKVTGLATEILTSVLDKMQIKYEAPAIYPWSRGEKMLGDGELSILYSGSKSDKRLQFAWFPAEPLIESKWVVFANKSEGLTYTKMEDLKDKSVGLVLDYAYTPEFVAFVKASAKVEDAPRDEINLKKLAAKRIQFTVCEYAVGMALIKKLGLEKDLVAFTDAPIKSTGLYYMFGKKITQQEPVDKFSAALKEFKASPEYDKIYHKYF